MRKLFIEDSQPWTAADTFGSPLTVVNVWIRWLWPPSNLKEFRFSWFWVSPTKLLHESLLKQAAPCNNFLGCYILNYCSLVTILFTFFFLGGGRCFFLNYPLWQQFCLHLFFGSLPYKLLHESDASQLKPAAPGNNLLGCYLLNYCNLATILFTFFGGFTFWTIAWVRYSGNAPGGHNLTALIWKPIPFWLRDKKRLPGPNLAYMHISVCVKTKTQNDTDSETYH